MYSTATGNGNAGFPHQYGQHELGGRGRKNAQEESNYIEGNLFGSTKTQGRFGNVDPTTRQPSSISSRTPYYGGGTNTYRSGGYGDPQPPPQQTPFAPQNGVCSGSHDSAAAAAGFGKWGDRVSASNTYTYTNELDQSGMRSGADAWPMEGSGGGGGAGTAPLLLGNGGSANGAGIGVGGLSAEDEGNDMPTVSLTELEMMGASSALSSQDNGTGTQGLRQRRGGGGQEGYGRTRPTQEQRLAQDLSHSTWVVVWGVPEGAANDVLLMFQRFGDILEQRGAPGSNWLYLRFATRLQAEKALCAGHGSRLSERVMLGVQEVDRKTLDDLMEDRIPLCAGSIPPTLQGETSRRQSTVTIPENDHLHLLTGRRATINDSDLLDAPPPRPRDGKGVCGRIMAFFGFH